MDQQNEEKGARFEGATQAPEPQQEQKPAAEMAGLTEGRIVHYVLQDGSHRPAIVVRNWRTPGGCCNLQVFLDGEDDFGAAGLGGQEMEKGRAWRTSVLYSAKPQPHTWHWPEKT
jgi:hypothetical protein